VRYLCTLLERSENIAILKDSFGRAWSDARQSLNKLSMILAAFCTTWPEDEIVPWLNEFRSDGEFFGVASLLLTRTNQRTKSDSSLARARWQNLTLMLTDLSFSNPNSNAAAAMLCATFAPVRMKYILALQLRHFQKKSVEFIGPFTHFTRNVLFFFYSAHEFPDSEELFNRTESTPRKHAISDVRRVRLERALRFINEV